MNNNTVPRCMGGKLPSLQYIPHLQDILSSNCSTKPRNCISPSPNGAFRPICSVNAPTVPASSPPKLTVIQQKFDNDITSLEPANGKRIFKECNEGEDKNKQHKTTEDKKAKRAEKNRKFAKESRDRKRKYILDLEAEVKHLREQLESHKQVLKKYELIEKHSNLLGREMYNTLMNVYREMYELDQPLTNHSLFIETLKKKISETFEEQSRVLTQITKVMMGIMLPLPIRISAWLSEKDIDLYDCEKALDKIGSEIPAEKVKMIVAHMRELYPDKEKYYEMQESLANAGTKIKSLMKQIIDHQKKVQIELINYERYLDTTMVNFSNPRFIEALVSLGPFFNCISELSDNAIWQSKGGD